MSKESLGRTLRHTKKANRIGHDPKCEGCGEEDIRALHLVHGCIQCTECDLEVVGRSPYERHHPAGRRNDRFSISIPANDHAVLSDAQNDWPKEVLMKDTKDILKGLAAWLLGLENIFDHISNKSKPWSKMLLDLRSYLEIKLGENWWEDFQNMRKEKGDE
jgi:hypothetical protein